MSEALTTKPGLATGPGSPFQNLPSLARLPHPPDARKGRRADQGGSARLKREGAKHVRRKRFSSKPGECYFAGSRRL